MIIIKINSLAFLQVSDIHDSLLRQTNEENVTFSYQFVVPNGLLILLCLVIIFACCFGCLVFFCYQTVIILVDDNYDRDLTVSHFFST